MEDEILDSDQQSSGQFDNINQGHDLPLVIDGQHIEMIQPMEVGGNQENDIFFEKPIEDSNNNIESNSSSFNRGPFMPVENIQDYSGNQEMLTKPAPTQNLIVDSSTDSEGEGNDMMNIEENYEDPFGDDDDSNSKRTFDPTNCNFYAQQNELSEGSINFEKCDPRSEGAMNVYSDLISSSKHDLGT
ncbi:unnamed protein product [Moneuplotes crassus]|uniref:Uncharacterized protein n=1 Tax=Euplotes crassus TaxID=5936 RepID=A0AAD1XVQ5_EUPCR|nr:unnamed protein product [Moneuplotes crassus]